jgi:hypothetical protein
MVRSPPNASENISENNDSPNRLSHPRRDSNPCLVTVAFPPCFPLVSGQTVSKKFEVTQTRRKPSFKTAESRGFKSKACNLAGKRVSTISLRDPGSKNRVGSWSRFGEVSCLVTSSRVVS